MKENILLIKKITFKHVFCFIYLFIFINSIKHVFLNVFHQFPNIYIYIFKTQKIIFKNRFSRQFSKTTAQHALNLEALKLGSMNRVSSQP